MVFRPVRPLAVRDPGFFKRIDPRWPGYVALDVTRLADMQDLPFALPQPDPIVQDMETRRISDVQPHIGRLTRLGQAAAGRGVGLEFGHAVARRIWGGVKDWHLGDHIREAQIEAGLDPDEVEACERAETGRLDKAIALSETAQDASGHWGVPLMVFQGEPFFGQDRIDALEWRLNRRPASPRPSTAFAV